MARAQAPGGRLQPDEEPEDLTGVELVARAPRGPSEDGGRPLPPQESRPRARVQRVRTFPPTLPSCCPLPSVLRHSRSHGFNGRVRHLAQLAQPP